MTVKHALKRAPLLLFLLVTGCATLPTGPSVLVLPGQGKTFDQFQLDDLTCRQWASQRIGIPPGELANQNVASGAVAGTIIGAGAGALLGAASGHPGAGAAIGAGGGLLVGSAAGASEGDVYGWEAQRRYDYAYMQCMYAKGNQIPGRVQRYREQQVPLPPPPPGMNAIPPGTNLVPPDYDGE